MASSPFLFLVFLWFALSDATQVLSEGWIFKRQINFDTSINQIQPTSTNALLISSNQTLYSTPFNSPDGDPNVIFNHFDEENQFTYSPYSNEVIYIEENQMNFVSLNPPSTIDIDKFPEDVLLIKSGQLIYFLDKIKGNKLNRYDLQKRTLTEGPELGHHFATYSMMTLSKTGKIFIILNQNLTIIDPLSLGIIQQIILNICDRIDIEFSQNDNYFQVSKTSQIDIYGFHSKNMRYEYLNTITNNLLGMKQGIHCEANGICNLAQFIYRDFKSSIILQTFNVSSFSFTPVARLRSDANTVLSDNGHTVLQFVDGSNEYTLFEILGEIIYRIETRQMEFDLEDEYKAYYLKLTNMDYLLGYFQGISYIWNLKKNIKVCTLNLPQRYKLTALFGGFVYYIDQNSLNVVDIDDQCKNTKLSPEKTTIDLLEITEEYIYLSGIFPSELIIYNRVTLQLIKNIPASTNTEVIQNNNQLFAWRIDGFRTLVKSIDADLRELSQTEIICHSGWNQVIKSGEYLAFACVDEFQVVDIGDVNRLKYIGTFTRSTDASLLKPTKYSNLMFTESFGILYRFEISQWSYSLIDSSKVEFTALAESAKFKDHETVYFYQRNGMNYTISKLVINDQFKKIHKNIGRNLSVSYLQFTSHNNYIVTKVLDLSKFKNYLYIYSMETLEIVKEIQITKGNGILSNGYYIDEQGYYIQSFPQKIFIFNLNDNYTQTPKNIIKITAPIAVSQTYEYLAIGGCNKNSQEIIQIWKLKPNIFMKEYIVPEFIDIDRIFILEEAIKVLFISSSTLYEITEINMTIVVNDVNYCEILDQSNLICKKTSGEIIIIQATSKNILQSSENNYYVNMILSINKKIILEYGTDNTISIKSLQKTNITERQKLASKQSHITKVAISSDNLQIITYDCTQKTANLWSYGKCPIHKDIQDGFCICAENLIDFGDRCGCNSGDFINQSGKCQACNFMCSQCEDASGNCTSVDPVEILMLVAGLLGIILIGLLIWKRVKGKGEKRVELVSELLQSQIRTQHD